MLNRIGSIFFQEWRLLWRQRSAAAMLILATLLLLSAGLASHWRFQDIATHHADLQHRSDEQWHGQPERHPHRVAHYGTFAFRPPSLLSFFDPGADRYSGNLVFLEAHRQNTANFSEARQASLLMRFGEWSPALVMQQLLPLLIIFLASGCLSAERESGRLRILIVQGARPVELLIGKTLCLISALTLVLLPTLLLALVTLLRLGDARIWSDAQTLFSAYGLWLLIWIFASVWMSAWLKRARDSLWALLGIWMVMVVVLPKLVASVAEARHPVPTRVELATLMNAEQAKLGDSHNPDDPHFSAFRKNLLDQYKVQRIEDLPVNYKGMVMQEGERISSELFARLIETVNQKERAQTATLRQFGLWIPLLSLRSVSMAMAGSDRAHAQHFADSAEQFRFGLISQLNHLQASQLRYATDAEQKLAASAWQALPQYRWTPPPPAEVHAPQTGALQSLWVWCLLLALACAVQIRNLEHEA